jgi:hypothetical protein
MVSIKLILKKRRERGEGKNAKSRKGRGEII